MNETPGMKFTRTSDFDMNIKSVFVRFYLGIANAMTMVSSSQTKDSGLEQSFMLMGTFYAFFRPKVNEKKVNASVRALDEQFFGKKGETDDAKFKTSWEALLTLKELLDVAADAGITMDFDWTVDDYESYGR